MFIGIVKQKRSSSVGAKCGESNSVHSAPTELGFQIELGSINISSLPDYRPRSKLSVRPSIASPLRFLCVHSVLRG